MLQFAVHKFVYVHRNIDSPRFVIALLKRDKSSRYKRNVFSINHSRFATLDGKQLDFCQMGKKGKSRFKTPWRQLKMRKIGKRGTNVEKSLFSRNFTRIGSKWYRSDSIFARSDEKRSWKFFYPSSWRVRLDSKKEEKERSNVGNLE